jgi:hypothetical protein
MDETTYSAQPVIEAINRDYLAVRVDNDQRPDINARYNQGGWPTTAFLTPDGSLLAGATYLPPEQMENALQQIAQFYAANQADIEQRTLAMRSTVRAPQPVPDEELNDTIVRTVLDAVDEQYDEEYGGFGTAPKFPMVDVLELLEQAHAVTGEQRYYEMLAHTLLAMSNHGMYDHVEGGFFRYSTTRDWTVPHFEKMTEDHAGLLRVLAHLVRRTRNDAFRSTLISALAYVRTTLRDPQTGLFGGSQDADEAYYALPLEERRTKPVPYVDRNSYTNWTAAMASAFVLAGFALDDDTALAQGEMALDALERLMRDPDGLLYHFYPPGGPAQIRGLLTDQAAYFRALLDAHEYTGEPRFLERARAMAKQIQRYFSCEDGSFNDTAAMEQPLGNLQISNRPIAENALLADSYVRLAQLTSDAAFRDIAERILRAYTGTYARLGLFAAGYARSVQRYVRQPISVQLVGSRAQIADLLEAAHNLPDALLSVRTIAPDDAGALQARGFDPHRSPAAYVCRNQVCAPPAQSAATLRAAYDNLQLPAG